MTRAIKTAVLSSIMVMMMIATAPAEIADAPYAVRPLLIGATIPEATLMTATGEPFDLNAAVAQKPTVLIFYRGGW